MNKFYVYALLDPRKPGQYKYGKYIFNFEPFYIGKGQCERMYAHYCPVELRRDRNPYKQRKIRKILALGIKPIPIKIIKGLDSSTALRLEKKIIKVIGRGCLKNGPLTNLDEGGRKSPKMTKKLRKKISDILKRKYRSGEIKRTFLGKTHTNATKAKMSASNRKFWQGKHLPKRTRMKIGNAVRGKNIPKIMNHYLFLSPNNKKIVVNYGLDKFSKESGLTIYAIRTLICGKKTKSSTRKGWSFLKIIKTNNTGTKKVYYLTSPNGKSFIVKNGLDKFCKKFKLHSTDMIKVAKGQRMTHKKWKCRYYD